jgi:UDP-N-acetylglucosamine 2-epimerase (non-hydrolysing)
MVVAARPNFMKVDPVIRAIAGRAQIDLVHTGQHYDEAMSDAFFRDLGLAEPQTNLEVGSGSHSQQTARVMLAYEKHLVASRPDAVVVVGDVNSTLGAALVSAKLGIPVAHVEAGLRSGDWSMPEEINRVVVDRLSQWLFTPSSDSNENLLREGIEADRIHLVGNVMIDTLQRILPEARGSFGALRAQLGLPTRYGVLTLHRPSNVDSIAGLRSILGAVSKISQDLDIYFAVHPRTRRRIGEITGELDDGIRYLDPMGYRDFLSLMDNAAMVLTDSGGIQEETSVLGVPCLTLRSTTERPITCELGTNRVVGTEPAHIVAAANEAKATARRVTSIPLWDGKAAVRIADVLLRDLATS